MNSSKERKKIIVYGRVKELREDKKMTQEEFAGEIEVTSNTISRIERRDMSLSSDIALKIADKFDVSLDWLFMLSNENLKLESFIEMARVMAMINPDEKISSLISSFENNSGEMEIVE